MTSFVGVFLRKKNLEKKSDSKSLRNYDKHGFKYKL